MGTGLGDEGRGRRAVEHAALQGEAALRVRREPPVITAVDVAQVALGVDVQLDRVEHGVGEQAAQERQREVLVRVVDAAQGRRLALLVQEVAEVVQQAGGDQLVVLLGEAPAGAEQRRLDGRTAHAQALADLAVAQALELAHDEDLVAPWRANRSSMSSRLSTPTPQRALSSAVPSAANCDCRIRVAVRAPADSRIG